MRVYPRYLSRYPMSDMKNPPSNTITISIVRTLANFSIKVCFTMDKWTSSSQNKSYLCITSHFVDKSWSLQQRLIGFINVHGSTGIDICNVFMNCLLEWNLHDKVLTVTVDNDKTNKVALRLARDRLKNSLPCNGIFFHVRCGANTTNLVVQSDLKTITKVIERVRLSVKYLTISPQMSEKFYHVANQVNLENQKRLSLDCCTM